MRISTPSLRDSRVSTRSPTTTTSVCNLYGDLTYIRFNTYENFRQLEPFADEIGGKSSLRWMKDTTAVFTMRHRRLFEDRLRRGRIKDGHGDLRADHIYFWNGIHIIDCIEFNDRFRFGDVAADLAFLFMDLVRLGYAREAHTLIRSYVGASEDLQLWFLLDFYTAYRAVVRAKVSCLETLSTSLDAASRHRSFDEARRFMRLATVHTVAYALPTIYVFMGLPASGKSSLAERLAREGHMPLISSDVLRKRIFPGASPVPFGEGVYSTHARDLVYETLIDEAVRSVAGGKSLVLDATFASRLWREKLLQRLSPSSCHTFFIETTAAEEVLAKRLLEREGEVTGASDARIDHLTAFSRRYEPPL